MRVSTAARRSRYGGAAMDEENAATPTGLSRADAIGLEAAIARAVRGALPTIESAVTAAIETSDANYARMVAERRIAAPLIAATHAIVERLRGQDAAIVGEGRAGERKIVRYAPPSWVDGIAHSGVLLSAHLAPGTTLDQADRLGIERDSEGDRVLISQGAKLPTAAMLHALESSLALGQEVTLGVHEVFRGAAELAFEPLLSRSVMLLDEAPAVDFLGPLTLAIAPFLYDRLEIDRIVEAIVGEHIASSVACSVLVLSSSTWLQESEFQRRLEARAKAMGISPPTRESVRGESAAILDAMFERTPCDTLGAFVHPLAFPALREQWDAKIEATSARLIALNVAPSLSVDIGALPASREGVGHQILHSVDRVTIEGSLRRTYWSTRGAGVAMAHADEASFGSGLRLYANSLLP
jgi:hypothetical protein